MPNSKKGYIYCLKNQINGKKYIGQTTDINQRIREHLSRDDRKGINQALAKYGIDNFELEILEKVSMDQIGERERYWIDKYNTFKGNGYNLKEGGGRNDGENNPMYGVKGEDHHSHGKPSPLRGKTRTPEFSKKISEALRETDQNEKTNHPKSIVDIKMSENILKDRVQKEMSIYGLTKKYGISTKPIQDILSGKHWTIEEGGLQSLVAQSKENLDHKVSNNDIKNVLTLRENGRTYKEIAQHFPFTYVVVGQICRGEHPMVSD